MVVGKPFAIDKTANPPVQMSRFQAFIDFWVYMGFCTAYIVQVKSGKLDIAKDDDAIFFSCVYHLSNPKNWLPNLFQINLCLST